MNKKKGFPPFTIEKEAKAMYVEEPEKQNKQRMDCLKLAVHSLFVLAVFDHSPPANGGYAGGSLTFEICAPVRTGSQEKSP
ncbi:hypothetical protein [Trichococcus shcherbakoviae]|uniref:hypothetical protein n=1 Tax=Trichococcus shcherbakoviae TaxID=2094020 RepID=UPI0029F4D486|nr:hypothetical protein [Trichococcus shcherbakoviae]